jgi:hypothetical protein
LIIVGMRIEQPREGTSNLFSEFFEFLLCIS